MLHVSGTKWVNLSKILLLNLLQHQLFDEAIFSPVRFRLQIHLEVVARLWVCQALHQLVHAHYIPLLNRLLKQESKNRVVKLPDSTQVNLSDTFDHDMLYTELLV